MLNLLLPIVLAFFVAWNLGANDVANSMGTSVGSKAVSLKQALIIAGILEFTGAVCFGGGVSQTLATGLVNLDLFIPQPQTLLLGMVAVLLGCGIWVQIATGFGLPVSSSHAIVGAIAGFSLIAMGPTAVNWLLIGQISLTWIITPLISGSLAAAFYSTLKRWILATPDPLVRLREWIPWLSVILLTAFGSIVLPSIFSTSPIPGIPVQDFTLGTGAIAAMTLTYYGWRQLNLAQSDSIVNFSNPTEQILAKFQLLSACFVAFAHGSNDVGNAIAPLATITAIQRTGTLPSESLQIPLWILILGALGIVSGLAILGKNVITTIGENITPLQPSGGFCAELATASTILFASRLGLPTSTSHALVGAVVGIGLIQSRDRQHPLQIKTLQNIGLAWIVTIPIAAVLGASLFSLIRLIF